MERAGGSLLVLLEESELGEVGKAVAAFDENGDEALELCVIHGSAVFDERG